MAIPLTLEGKDSHKTYVPYFSQEALMLPHTKRAGSQKILGFTKSDSNNTNFVKSEGFSRYTKKGCFSMRRLHLCRIDAGLAVRPSIPKAKPNYATC